MNALELDTVLLSPDRTFLEILDQKSAQANISRNEFINQCILFALAHMENEA